MVMRSGRLTLRQVDEYGGCGWHPKVSDFRNKTIAKTATFSTSSPPKNISDIVISRDKTAEYVFCPKFGLIQKSTYFRTGQYMD